jgi:hypothetical protein
MTRTIKVVLRKKDKLRVNIELQPAANESSAGSAQLVAEAGEPLKARLKAKQRFHLRNHVHYGHQVHLGHHRVNAARVNRRELLRSPVVEQPADWLEQIVQDKAKMIEMHAF